MTSFINQVRNDLTWMICNFSINHLAVGRYRDFLRTVYGMGVERFDEEFWKFYEERKAEQDAGGRDNEEVA
jgi:hypothetical protein